MLPIKNTLAKISVFDRLIPWLLLALTAIGHAYWIGNLGLYGSEWQIFWVMRDPAWGHSSGIFATDGTIAGGIYYIFTLIFRDQLWGYHLLALVLRWLCASALWKLLSILWKRHQRENFFVAALFTVYIGYKQQPLALQSALGFLSLLFLIASFGLSLQSARKPVFRTGIAIALQVASFLIDPIFIGIEAMRPIFFWMAQKDNGAGRLRRAARSWLPFALTTAAFLAYWEAQTAALRTTGMLFVTQFRQDTPRAILQFLSLVLGDLVEVSIGVFRQILRLPAEANAILPYIAFVVFLAFVIALIGRRMGTGTANAGSSSSSSSLTRGNWAFQCLLLGLFAIFCGGWSIWLTFTPIKLSFPWDASTLPLMVGASLMMVGLVTWIFQSRFRIFFLAVIVSLSAGATIQNAADFAGEWTMMQTFLRQMGDRIPNLEPGSIILSEELPFKYNDQDSLTAAANLLYAPAFKEGDLSYLFLTSPLQLAQAYPLETQVKPVQYQWRALHFEGDTDKILFLYYRPNACLRVLTVNDLVLPNLPARLWEALQYQKAESSLIKTSRLDTLPVFLQGGKQDWCSAFEAADLAQQQGDWQSVAKIGRDAFSQGLYPQDQSETLLFIEAFGKERDWRNAHRLTSDLHKNGALLGATCAVWKRLEAEPALNNDDLNTIHQILSDLGC